jgi:hypothetical protein
VLLASKFGGTNYDELEHSIFERILTCGTIPNFITTWFSSCSHTTAFSVSEPDIVYLAPA